MDDDKEYIAEMRLGVTTDTGDLEGNVKDIRPIKVTEFDLKEALRQFTVKSHSTLHVLCGALQREKIIRISQGGHCR